MHAASQGLARLRQVSEAMQQLTSAFLGPSASLAKDAHALYMHVASKELANHRQVSEAMQQHALVLLAPSESHEGNAHA